jgi:hypothetical protein
MASNFSHLILLRLNFLSLIVLSIHLKISSSSSCRSIMSLSTLIKRLCKVLVILVSYLIAMCPCLIISPLSVNRLSLLFAILCVFGAAVDHNTAAITIVTSYWIVPDLTTASLNLHASRLNRLHVYLGATARAVNRTLRFCRISCSKIFSLARNRINAFSARDCYLQTSN